MSGSSLKLIALITMIIDHIGAVLLRKIPSALVPLFTVHSNIVSWYVISRMIGRIAFPIYCFLLVEGFVHTHSKKKYGINLFVFAIVSEIPWNLEHTGKLTYSEQNVFFTLFIGFLGMYFYQKYDKEKVKQLTVLLALFLFSSFFKADYGSVGYCFILLMYVLIDKKVPRALIGSCLLSTPKMVLISFVPINMYNGKRGFIKGKVLKYVFYSAYPIHIMILYIIKLKYFGYT